MAYTLAQLAEHVGASYQGAPDCLVNGIATLETAQAGQLTFLSNPLYRKYLSSTKASIVILSQEDLSHCGTHAIITPNPYLAYARIARLFDDAPMPAAGIHPSAVIAPTASVHPTAAIGANAVIEADALIEENAIIGAGCVIGERVKVGKNTRLWANVTLYHGVQVGERVIIHSGCVVGSDGFGLAFDNGAWYKISQIGKVVIHDDVEIGANTTIDRGAIGDTIIEKGVKLDNQIQIGHNVQIGAHSAIAGCTGISGSTKIGKYCRIGGGSGIAGHIEIADKVVVTGMSMVTNSITEAGIYSSGTGLQDNRSWQKNAVRFRRLDDMSRQLKVLEKRLGELENLLNKQAEK